MIVTFRVEHLGRTNRAPTIYEALREKLGREPTNAELCADVRRILTEARVTPGT